MDSYREIENLVYTYAELIDTGNLEGLAQLFSHAEFLGPDGKVAATGAEELFALQRQAVQIYAETGTPLTKHVTTNLIIEVDETADSATARSYFTVLQSAEGLSLQPVLVGRYDDRFECVEGKWQFRRRQIVPEHFGDLSKHLLFDIVGK